MSATITPVVCAVIEKDGLYFLARRPEGRRLAGLWEFPGGKIDPGESAEHALHRELHEELGCTVVVRQALTPSIHEYPWGTIELIPFLCRLAPGGQQPHPHEHSAITWTNLEEMRLCDLAPADIPVIEEVRRIKSAALMPVEKHG